MQRTYNQNGCTVCSGENDISVYPCELACLDLPLGMAVVADHDKGRYGNLQVRSPCCHSE